MQAVSSTRSYLALAIGTGLLFAPPARPESVADYFVGHTAPDFTLKDLEGNEVHLSSLKGHVVLVDFWASWCGPCRMEIPMLEHISKKFAKQGLVVIGVNSQEPEDVVKRFATKNKMNYPIVTTEHNPAVMHAYAVRGLPTLVVIDKSGMIAAYRVGVNANSEQTFVVDIHHVTSSKYVPPQPKPVQIAQIRGSQPTSGTSSMAGPDPNWQPKTAIEFLARAHVWFKMRNYAQTKADAEDALRLRPKWAQAQFLRGAAAYAGKDYAAAITDFDAVIQQEPDWADAYRYRGLAYSYSGQHERALDDYRQAVELNPHSAAAYNALGWAYFELGQFTPARTNLDKAIEIDPDFIVARQNRARLFAKEGEVTAELEELSILLGL